MKTFPFKASLLIWTVIISSFSFVVGYPGISPESVILPRGSVLLIRTSERINTEYSRSGEIFTGILAADVTADGRVVIPSGTEVEGRIIEAVRAKNLGRRAQLSLEITHVVLDRQLIPVTTYPVSSEGRSAKTGEKVGGGAVIGGVLGGWDGVKNGALIGLGVAAVTRGNQIEIPRGALLEFEVRVPVTLEAMNY